MNQQPVSYLQTDPRWSAKDYSARGEKTTIGASGCGPTAMAMVLATWADPQVTPATECAWALAHLDRFPGEVNTAAYHTLLRVPGIGVVSARRILAARRWRALDEAALGKLGVVMKRAQYFLTCSGRMTPGLRVRPEGVRRALTALEAPALAPQYEQLSLFPT